MDRSVPPPAQASYHRRVLALGAILFLAFPSCSGEAPPPHVVIWMVDTLRADHLGCYGYPRPTTPVMDKLAEDGVLFSDLHVHSNWTQPSVASLMSGRFPPLFSEDFQTRCPDDFVMAAEWFSQYGWETAGFTSTVATAHRFGFAQGFETYEELDLLEAGRDRKFREGSSWDADGLVDEAISWLDWREKRTTEEARPFFLFLHSVDPHVPYERHEGMATFTRAYEGALDGKADTLHKAKGEDLVFSPEDIRHLTDLYDDEVAFNDAQLGRLLDALAEKGLTENTLVVVLSDHGEEFWDHASHGHGHRNLHRELTHVPWIMKWPAGLSGGHRVEGLVRGIDVLPTLLDLTGLPPLPDAAGGSLADVARGEVQQPPEATLMADRAKNARDFMALRTRDLLYLSDPDGIRTALFRLTPEGEQPLDLLKEGAALAVPLEATLQEWRDSRAPPGSTVEMDAVTEQGLRELGYLGDGG